MNGKNVLLDDVYNPFRKLLSRRRASVFSNWGKAGGGEGGTDIPVCPPRADVVFAGATLVVARIPALTSIDWLLIQADG